MSACQGEGCIAPFRPRVHQYAEPALCAVSPQPPQPTKRLPDRANAQQTPSQRKMEADFLANYISATFPFTNAVLLLQMPTQEPQALFYRPRLPRCCQGEHKDSRSWKSNSEYTMNLEMRTRRGVKHKGSTALQTGIQCGKETAH